jgi:hypothetical protein
VGTGDFTHPGRAEELKETLIPAEPGLFRLRPEMAERVRRNSPHSCSQQARFMLSAEISTIYRAASGPGRFIIFCMRRPSMPSITSPPRYRRSAIWLRMAGRSLGSTHAICSRSRWRAIPAAISFHAGPAGYHLRHVP